MAEDACLALKPANLTWEEAAAIPFGANTALYAHRYADTGHKRGSVVITITAEG